MTKVTIAGNDYFSNDDGITHINIYSNGATPLGRFLSNFTHCTVETPHGKFESLEGYYHYIKSLIALAGTVNTEVLYAQFMPELDQLHWLYGKAAQQHGRLLRQQLMTAGAWFDDTRSIVCTEWFIHALKNKIANSEFKVAFLASTLPFTHYYVYGHSINHKPHYNDLSDVLTDLRSQGVDS